MSQKPIRIQYLKLQMDVNLPKNVLDGIEKDVTDGTGQKEVMGGSVQVENQF